jgi:hypothetical protein
VPATPIAASTSASLLRTCKQPANERNPLYAQSSVCAVAHLGDRTLGSEPCSVAYSRAVQLGSGADLEPKQAHRLVRADHTEQRQLDRYAIRRGCAAPNDEGERQVVQLQPGNRLQSPQSGRRGEAGGGGRSAHVHAHTTHGPNEARSKNRAKLRISETPPLGSV